MSHAQVQKPCSSPEETSFWLAANMALPAVQRQKLLEASHTVGRLRLARSFLRQLGALVCSYCHTQVSIQQVLLMPLSDLCGAFMSQSNLIVPAIASQSASSLRDTLLVVQMCVHSRKLCNTLAAGFIIDEGSMSGQKLPQAAGSPALQ